LPCPLSASGDDGAEHLSAALIESVGGLIMGELMDALDALDDRGPAADPANPFDQAAQAFRTVSLRVNEAIEAVREPGMPLDMLASFTRQAPLQALAVAFLVGVIVTRRR
jgi:hypothetical protein